MRKCVNCGASLDDDAMFCVVCGTKAQPAGLQFDGWEFNGIFINRDGKRMSFIMNDGPPTSKPDTSTSAPSSDPDAQYVKVTGVNVRLRTTPSINDNNIIKYARGKNVHPYKGEKLKMVSEEDEFYLVIYRGNYVYISKQFAVLE